MDTSIRDALKVNIKWMTNNGLLEEAKRMLSHYEEEVSEDWEIYSLKSDIAKREENYDKAIEILLEGCAWYDENPCLLYELGCAYTRIEEYALAQNSYRQALKNMNDPEMQIVLREALKEAESKNTENCNPKKPEGKIYIVCLTPVATGGTELLHQLCDKLSRLGCDAYMFYGKVKEPVPERFKKYRTRYIMDVYDTEGNIFIVPEVMPQLALKIMNAKSILWWLSVDNFFRALECSGETEENIIDLIKRKEDNRLLHFVQSQYAKEYLLGKGISPNEVEYLSDYLNKEFMVEAMKGNPGHQRYANVLYNPAKGYEFTQKLIKASPELNWIPLHYYSPEEMRILMCRSMVYVDFGNHPGKDRIPREAAICGCCIIVGLRGAAANPCDIPIPSEYKIEDREENIPAIIGKIKEVAQNYDVTSRDYDDYRKKIKEEEIVFEKDIKNMIQLLYEKEEN